MSYGLQKKHHQALVSKKVKRIDQINKDIVYGYIKEAQMLLPSQSNSYYTIDQLIQDVCLLYFSCVDFEDKYELMEEIDVYGNAGESKYRCKSTSDGSIFEVKIMAKDKLYDKNKTKQFQQSLLKSMQDEVEIMRRINHI